MAFPGMLHADAEAFPVVGSERKPGVCTLFEAAIEELISWRVGTRLMPRFSFALCRGDHQQE